jgi:hypothetical protein
VRFRITYVIGSSPVSLNAVNAPAVATSLPSSKRILIGRKRSGHDPRSKHVFLLANEWKGYHRHISTQELAFISDLGMIEPLLILIALQNERAHYKGDASRPREAEKVNVQIDRLIKQIGLLE